MRNFALKIKAIIDWLFDELILGWLPEKGEDDEQS